MADTTVDSTVNVEQWADDEFYEYTRRNRFRSLMGNDENSVIQVKEDLMKDKGDLYSNVTTNVCICLSFVCTSFCKKKRN